VGAFEEGEGAATQPKPLVTATFNLNSGGWILSDLESRGTDVAELWELAN